MSIENPGQQLAHFAARLHFEDIPAPVLRRAEDLMLDWIGSTLAGKGARPVESIAHFMEAMGPADGPSEILIHRRGSSPLVAAACNAAASHVAEQDDVHNGSVFHPGAVVFPAALAVAQALGRSGDELLTAVVAGYEVGIRVGEFLGRSHYRIFHTTGTAGTLAACAVAGRLLCLSPQQMEHAFGSAGTQAAGLGGSQYVSIRYSERLTEAGIEPSVGSKGDSYDNALAETINGLYKAELIHRRVPWKTKEAVELATLEWVAWFNHHRLLEPIGYIPPAEAEANYYRQLTEQAMSA